MAKIPVKGYSRNFSATKLPPRSKDGKWKPKGQKLKKSKQVKMF